MTPLHLSAIAMVCPVGLTAPSACAALRAGIDGFTDLPYLDDDGEPIVGAVIPDLAPDLRGRPRLMALGTMVFEALPQRLPAGLDLQDCPLIFCTREPERPGARFNSMLQEIETGLGITFRRDGSCHVDKGQVAAFEAIARVAELLVSGEIKACLIAAVDSLIDARSLNWLDRAQRLKTSTQSDGAIPGEAACLILASLKPMTPTSVTVQGLGFGMEPATVLDDEPLLGEGMAAAVRQALAQAGLEMHEVAFRLSDVAGESYAFEELVLAQSRLSRQPRASQDLWHPAECVGDCGAASGLVQLAWAEQAFANAYAPGPTALAHASTASGARAAAVLQG